LNAAPQRYDVAPLTALQETVNVTPLASDAPLVTLGAGGGGGIDGDGGGGGGGGGGGADAAVTVKVTLPDVPPPGAGVTTVTGTERAVARSAAVIAARS